MALSATHINDRRNQCRSKDHTKRNRRGPGTQRTLIYRATRRLPRTRRALGRLTTVHHWEEEHYELEIEVEAGRVSAVQSRIRRARAAS